jgi:hypothetical protein
MKLRKLASATSECLINLDHVDLTQQGLEFADCVAQVPSGEPTKTMGLSESSASLRVRKPDANDPIRAFPQRCGTVRAALGNQQRDDR